MSLGFIAYVPALLSQAFKRLFTTPFDICGVTAEEIMAAIMRNRKRLVQFVTLIIYVQFFDTSVSTTLLVYNADEETNMIANGWQRRNTRTESLFFE